MIDLSKKDLPNAIVLDGKSFYIKTDFRYWIDYNYKLQNCKITLEDLFNLFESDINLLDIVLFNEEINRQFMDFLTNKNITPNMTVYSNVKSDRIFDYVLDGEYIYASFMQAYNIDLVDIEYLHWHKFKALFLSLPENTKMKEIMKLRAYSKDSVKYETRQLQMKEMWRLPPSEYELNEQKKLIEEINKEFYNC